MEKEVSFKVNDKVVTITFNSKDYFGISTDIYKLAVIESDEIAENVREEIEDNLDYYVNDLQDNSISELVDDRVYHIMNDYDDYHEYDDNIYSETKDGDLIQVEFVAGGQSYDELLELLPDSNSIKELIILWKKYQLKGGVDTAIINRTNDLLNQLDSGKDEYDLAEEIVNDYIKQNY